MPEAYPDTNLRLFFSDVDSSVMKAIAKLYINFAWIVPVEAAEGDAVVEFHAAVGHVHCVQRSGEPLAEILAQRKIE